MVAGTVARILGRQGQPVLALDVDPLPGLAFALGLGHLPDAGLPAELAERQEGKGWIMKESVTADELVDRYAVVGPNDVRFLQLGKLPHHVHPGSTVAFRHVIESFHRPGWSVVGDLSAGTRQAFFGWASFATRIVLISEPTPAGLLTVSRLKRLTGMMPEAAIGLILNKADGDRRTREAAQALHLPVWSIVPYDEEVVMAERKGLAPIDAVPRSKAVSAIERFVDRMLALG